MCGLFITFDLQLDSFDMLTASSALGNLGNLD